MATTFPGIAGAGRPLSSEWAGDQGWTPGLYDERESTRCVRRVAGRSSQWWSCDRYRRERDCGHRPVDAAFAALAPRHTLVDKLRYGAVRPRRSGGGALRSGGVRPRLSARAMLRRRLGRGWVVEAARGRYLLRPRS